MESKAKQSVGATKRLFVQLKIFTDAGQMSYKTNPNIKNLTILIPSFSSKRGHVKKKHVLIGYQTWHVWPPNI